MRILLLGSTDFTLAVAEMLVATGRPPAAVLSMAPSFRISYQSDPVRNSRWVDMGRWCADAGVLHAAHEGPDSIACLARQSGAELCLVAGWYHMLTAAQRALFPSGCLGLHASLLPAYRGGAPLNWVLINGEHEAGVSLFQLGNGVDDGLIAGQRRFPIGPEDYIADLLKRADMATAELLRDCLPGLADGSLKLQPQTGPASYGLQRRPEDGRINWHLPAVAIHRLIRAVSRPYPGALTRLEGHDVVIWRASLAEAAPPVYGAPGQIAVLPGLTTPLVVTGHGLLAIDEAEDAKGPVPADRWRRLSQRRFDPS